MRRNWGLKIASALLLAVGSLSFASNSVDGVQSVAAPVDVVAQSGELPYMSLADWISDDPLPASNLSGDPLVEADWNTSDYSEKDFIKTHTRIGKRDSRLAHRRNEVVNCPRCTIFNDFFHRPQGGLFMDTARLEVGYIAAQLIGGGKGCGSKLLRKRQCVNLFTVLLVSDGFSQVALF